MRRILLVLIAVLALAGAAVWLATRTARGLRPAVARLPAAEVEPGAHALAAPPTRTPEVEPGTRDRPSRPPEPATTPASRRQPASLEDAAPAHVRWVEGRVIFPAGTPADERVFVTANGRKFEDGSHHRVEVARDGTFRVAFRENTLMGRFELDARYLYLKSAVRWEGWKGEEPDTAVVLQPELGARIAGRVRLPAGADAGSIGGSLKLQANNQHVSLHELSNGLDFAFDRLIPGMDHERIYELSYDGEVFLGRIGKLVPEAGKTLLVELDLRPGTTLAGVVRDETGALLEGVDVGAVVESGPGSWELERWRDATSAADGSFRLGALVGGEVEVRAQLRGYAPLVRELGRLDEGRNVRGLELVLSRGCSISGTVRWPDGSPAEATLVLMPHRTGATRGIRDDASGKSDASGAFSISGLSRSSYRVTARATKTEEVEEESETTGKGRTKEQKSQWSAKLDSVEAGTQDLVLVLSSGLEISGRVVDDLGAPLEDFWVLADWIGSRPGSRDRSGKRSRSFRETDGSFWLDGFAPGEWEIWARSRKHAPSEPVRTTLPDGGPVVLVVPREAVVRGCVLAPGGAPVAGASVSVGWDSKRPRFFDSDHEDTTDRKGCFAFDGLGPGSLVLRARASSFAPSEPLSIELRAGETRSDLVLWLQLGGTILGELIGADGRPQSGRTVWVSGQHLGSGVSSGAATDADGRFQVTGVSPGDVDLSVETLEGIRLEQRVCVALGETVHVRLAPPGSLVRLYGRVRAGGEPLANAHVYASRVGEEDRSFRGASSSSKSDEDGSYELRLPGAGRYWLSIQGDDETSLSWRATVDAPAVEALAFDVSIPIGRISGRVTDAQGQVLEGVLVQSEPERHEGGAHGSARVLTDADGRYELFVPAGRHAVRAGGEPGWFGERELPYAEARVGNLVVGENDHLRGVDLRLDTGAVLEGVVRLPDGSGAGETWIWAQASFGQQNTRTDETGRFDMRLAAGSYLVGASSRDDTACVPVKIELASGETRRIELALLPARLVSLTIVKDGAPVGCELQVLDERGKRQRAQTGENGKAWLGPLIPGRYTVRARRDGEEVERAFEVRAEDEEPELELVFE